MYEKETLTQVFSCEFCEISKNTFLHRTPVLAASIFFEVFLIQILQFGIPESWTQNPRKTGKLGA